jgi:GNAT superfamily N-acetyltransferase
LACRTISVPRNDVAGGSSPFVGGVIGTVFAQSEVRCAVHPKGPPLITVTALQADDRANWEELFSGYNAFYGRTWTAQSYDDAWRKFEQDTRIHALGARLGGRLVGIAHFLVHASTTSPDVCYLQDLFTAPDARGVGVARTLIGAIEEWARGQGCDRLYWHTQQHNHTARRLYDGVAEFRDFIVYTMPL